MKKKHQVKARADFFSSARAFLSHPATLAACKISIGVLFILSSVTKIPDTARFADSIANYKILPQVLLMPMAVIVPWIQMIAGILIILDIYAKSSAFILSGLLVTYIIAIASAWARGIDIECGCFDLLTKFGLEERVGLEAIIRDLVFLAFPGIVFLFDKNGFNIYGLSRLFKK
jgi:putative oxidoreductase